MLNDLSESIPNRIENNAQLVTLEYTEENLIDQIGRRPVIWNPNHSQHYHTTRREDAIAEIAVIFPGKTPSDISKKWNSLIFARKSGLEKGNSKDLLEN